jgi:hypothetical protein
VVRLIASLGDYVYATAAGEIYVNLFMASDAGIELGGSRVRLRQETRYPWEGVVRIHVEPQGESFFALCVRVPGWSTGSVMPGGLYRYANADAGAAGPRLRLNGRPVEPETRNGYARIEREWSAGDIVELELPMPVRRVHARDEVLDDRGRVALERGPLVYCAEWPDNDSRALNIVVPDDVPFESEFRTDLLGGVQTIRGDVRAIVNGSAGEPMRTVPHRLVAIPYYAWANRGMGEMAVWLAREPDRAWLPPPLPPGFERVRTSGGVEKEWTGYNDQNDDLAAIYDGREPLNSADQSHRFFRMRPPVGSRAWLEYQFRTARRIATSSVYWFDDKRFCRLPASWRILYLTNSGWVPVTATRRYLVEKDRFCVATFEPVTTTAVRLEVEPQTVHYASGQIGPPAAMFLDDDVDWREFGLIEWRVA